MIFCYGIYTLFVREVKQEERIALRWLEIKNITSLKTLLAEVIIIILFVKFLNVVILNIADLRWEILILPASVLLLALGLKFLDQRH